MFETSIPTVAEILTMVPQGSGDLVLHSNTPYWIVGGTTQGQQVRERVILSPSNISAFALIGSRVSEPSAIGL